MPIELQYVDFFIGIFGFVFTCITLKTAYSVRKRILIQHEMSEFKSDFSNISGNISGYKTRINNMLSRDQSTLNEIDQFLTDTKSKYTFLSFFTKIYISLLSRFIAKFQPETGDWNKLVKKLIKLNNILKKEKL